MIRTATELREAVQGGLSPTGTPFSVSVCVTIPACDRIHRTLAAEDGSGAVLIGTADLRPRPDLAPGDCVVLEGEIVQDRFGHPFANGRTARIIGRKPPAAIPEFIPRDFAAGRYDNRPVRIDGTISDAFIDEIDPDFMFYLLDCDGERIVVGTESDGRSSADCPSLCGHRVSLTGVCRTDVYGVRTRFGRNIRTLPELIRFVDGVRADPFDARKIDRHCSADPGQVASPERRRVRGLVLAAWNGDRALLRTADGELVRITVSGGNAPGPGTTVEAVGFPETDLSRINLTRAFWRVSTPSILDNSVPERVSVRQLFVAPDGRSRYDPTCHGKHVIVSGEVRGVFPDTDGTLRLLLESERRVITAYVPLQTGPVPRWKPGAIVEAEGVCVMDTESWSPYSLFPRAHEPFVSIDNPAHVRIVVPAPWWTPERSKISVLVLVAMICTALLWIFALRRVVRRKGRELEQEITSRLASDLKMRERTRLAVELHDSIAQNLTGTAMEIDTAIHLARSGNPAMSEHLVHASKSLHSCRDELRDCLWDLRSRALEETSMDAAIRTTLMPFVDTTGIILRFNVPRNRLSDNTAHALLRIVRELVSNAIRHGHASRIHIAGSLDGPHLRFSVRDDGGGFDPKNRPDVDQGHFGLDGILERVRRFGGEMRIESTRGRGTKVSISLDVRSPEEEDLNDL